jgi:ABC-type polar amino acid transport system ATPase subunit
MTQAQSQIEIRAVSKWFGSHRVLDSVSASVGKGEAVVIIGPSGSGKTTLLRCVNFLEDFQEGEILIGGEAVGYISDSNSDLRRRRSECDIACMRAEVGMIFQSFNLFPHLSVLRNVTYGPIKVSRIAPQLAEENALALLRKVGLEAYADRMPGSLSGGQRQRVAIARALAMQPKALLCDEITSSLDPERVSEVQEVLRQLVADGMTVLMVTHEMAFARSFADRILFMAEGRVVETGSSVKMFNSPETERLKTFLRQVN